MKPTAQTRSYTGESVYVGIDVHKRTYSIVDSRRMGFVPQPITKPIHSNLLPFNDRFVSGVPSVNPPYGY